MKNIIKSLALFGLAAVASLSLVSCASVPTTEEVFEKFESENAKIVMEMDVGELMSTKMTLEVDGDKTKTTTETTTMGVDAGEVVMYVEKDGDTEYIYSEGLDGEWTKTDVEIDEDDEDEIEAMKDLFNPEHYEAYDKKNKCYTMKDDVEVELEGMTVSNAVIEIGEDSYTLKADIDAEGMEGELKMTVSDFGEMKVDLPEVK